MSVVELSMQDESKSTRDNLLRGDRSGSILSNRGTRHMRYDTGS